MAVETIATHARDGAYFTISITFTDEVPISVAPTAATWTLTDMDGNVINGRDAVTIASPTTTETITLTGTDTTIIAGQTNARMLLAEWTYNSTHGNNRIGKKQAIIVIDDLLHIT